MTNKITTADCRDFLATRFSFNSAHFDDIWDDDDPAKIEAISHAVIPKNWVRAWKVKPKSNDFWAKNGKYNTEIGPMDIKDINAVRCFVLSPDYFDSLVQFIVIEDKLGNIYLGDDIGE